MLHSTQAEPSNLWLLAGCTHKLTIMVKTWLLEYSSNHIFITKLRNTCGLIKIDKHHKYIGREKLKEISTIRKEYSKSIILESGWVKEILEDHNFPVHNFFPEPQMHCSSPVNPASFQEAHQDWRPNFSQSLPVWVDPSQAAAGLSNWTTIKKKI